MNIKQTHAITHMKKHYEGKQINWHVTDRMWTSFFIHMKCFSMEAFVVPLVVKESKNKRWKVKQILLSH